MYLDGRGALARSRAYHVRRREPRYVSSIPVTLQRFLRFGPFVTRGVSLDISVRGMSALVCGAPRVGETVVIALPLPDAPVEMLATVRHSSDARSGFEFYPLSPIAQQGIQDWIQELRKHEEKLFPYPYAGAAKVGSG
ncbi:MAG TPA: PilZ domain-containing protein [Terriglobales bacterium]|jgi:c-di-GMP-binding flagellar brake protein YcgR